MKKILILLFLLTSFTLYSQKDSTKIVGIESIWDQGIPFCPDDEYITNLINQIDVIKIRDSKNSELSAEEKAICVEIGVAFYSRGEYDASNWYLNRTVNSMIHPIETKVSASKEYVYLVKEVFVNEPKKDEKIEKIDNEKENNFISSLPQSYDNLSKEDLKKVAKEIDNKIKKLLAERDSLQNVNASSALIDSKNGTIKTLSKEKEIIDLTVVKGDLEVENKELEVQKSKLRTYLIWSAIGLILMGLSILALLQRKTIKVQDVEIENQLKDISKKNTYIEHVARIIRHDMHSGINTYIPRGISSLEKRLSDEDAKKLKIDGPIKMIKEGLTHTQKVYKSVYEFTNLVKQEVVLERNNCDLSEILNNHLKNTSFKPQVELIGDLGMLNVNEILFCNAIDSLIRNGLKYNESDEKKVKIYIDGNYLTIEDNGKGLSEKEFDKIINSRKTESKDEGLGLNICFAILSEHGFELSCQKQKIGTKMNIKIK